MTPPARRLRKISYGDRFDGVMQIVEGKLDDPGLDTEVPGQSFQIQCAARGYRAIKENWYTPAVRSLNLLESFMGCECAQGQVLGPVPPVADLPVWEGMPENRPRSSHTPERRLRRSNGMLPTSSSSPAALGDSERTSVFLMTSDGVWARALKL